jgi:hypothetical protein
VGGSVDVIRYIYSGEGEFYLRLRVVGSKKMSALNNILKV